MTFSDESIKIADFTLVVIAESSIYAPVPSLVRVDAHPVITANIEIHTATCRMRYILAMMLSPFCLMMILFYSNSTIISSRRCIPYGIVESDGGVLEADCEG
jgi:hypothetical protein